jgi:hypothetical protein
MQKTGGNNAARMAPTMLESSGELVSARRRFVQDLAGAGFACAATGRNTETIFQLLQVGGALRGRLAYFPLGNRVADADVHGLL